MNLAWAAVDDLVDAKPAAIAELSARWRSLGTMAAGTADGLSVVTEVRWSGTASDVFFSRFERVAPVLAETAEALGSAVAVLEDWLSEVAAARSQVADAISMYRAGEREHRWWLEQHAVIAAETGVSIPDPGIATMDEAERTAGRAVRRLEEEATTVEVRLRAVADQALERFSAWEDLVHTIRGVATGIGDGVVDLWKTTTMFSPVRLLLDSDGVMADLTSIVAGAAGVGGRFWSDPDDLLADLAASVVGFDTFVSDPARWAGQAVPDLAASATGVGAVRRAAPVLEAVGPLPLVDPDVFLRLAGMGLVRWQDGVPNAHFLLRHGAHTTRDQQLTRALTGVTPDGKTGDIVTSTRFLSDNAMFEAMEEGMGMYKLKPEKEIYVTMDDYVGEGYRAGTTGLVRTIWVEMRFGQHGPYTAFPRLDPPPRR